MARVAVIGAGGPAGANVSRSLREAGHTVLGIDGNPYHAALIRDEAIVQRYHPFNKNFIPWLAEVCAEHDIEYLHPQPDEAVEIIARYRFQCGAHTLLPAVSTVLICQDKFESGIAWRRAGLRESRILKIENEDAIPAAGAEFGYPYWMRATRGAGARGASEIHSYDMGYAWWRYWVEAGQMEWEWIAEEFLPGRDYAWTSLWYEGKLITSQARERLEYIYPHLAPSGRTGTPTVAVTVHLDSVNTMATEAVLAIDPRPHGLFCVDLREDTEGVPRPTEINVGRFFTTSHFYTAAGLNIPDMCVQLAINGQLDHRLLQRGEDDVLVLRDEPQQYDALPAGLHWIRHIDCPAQLAVKQGEQLVTLLQPAADPLWREWYEASRKI